MKIDTSLPGLPIDRLKRPVKMPDASDTLAPDETLAGKEGDELDKTVRRLYECRIDNWLAWRKK